MVAHTDYTVAAQVRILPCALEKEMIEDAEKRDWEINYTTYNSFDLKVFAPSQEKAKEIVTGLRALRHVTRVEEPVLNREMGKAVDLKGITIDNLRDMAMEAMRRLAKPGVKFTEEQKDMIRSISGLNNDK